MVGGAIDELPGARPRNRDYRDYADTVDQLRPGGR
jgi:hypothetical protein